MIVLTIVFCINNQSCYSYSQAKHSSVSICVTTRCGHPQQARSEYLQLNFYICSQLNEAFKGDHILILMSLASSSSIIDYGLL